MNEIPRAIIPTDKWEKGVLEAVGEITIAAAQLEHVLWLLEKRIKLKSFEDMSEREWKKYMLNRDNIDGRCKQINRLVDKSDWSDDNKVKLRKLLDKAKDVYDERNTVVHGRWGCKKNEGENIISWHCVSYSRETGLKDRGVDIGDLRSLRDALRDLRDRLQEIVPPTSKNMPKKKEVK